MQANTPPDAARRRSTTTSRSTSASTCRRRSSSPSRTSASRPRCGTWWCRHRPPSSAACSAATSTSIWSAGASRRRSRNRPSTCRTIRSASRSSRSRPAATPSGGSRAGRARARPTTDAPRSCRWRRRASACASRIEREKGKVAWGELVAIERPGPDRVPPPCPLFGTCGGCQWQHVTLAAQHAAKRAIVERALGVPLTAVRRRQSALRLPRSRQAGGRAGRDARVSARGGRTTSSTSPRARCSAPELARALPALRATARGLAAGVEIDVQAGNDGVHVNVAQADPTSAAHARREIDRLGAAGVVGLSLAGKPTLGRPGRRRRRAGIAAAARSGGRLRAGRARRQRGARRGRDGGGRPVAGRRARALRRAAGTSPATWCAPARRPWRRRDGDPAAIARGARNVPEAAWSLRPPAGDGRHRRARSAARGRRQARTWRPPRARAGASSTCRAIRRRCSATRACCRRPASS